MYVVVICSNIFFIILGQREYCFNMSNPSKEPRKIYFHPTSNESLIIFIYSTFKVCFYFVPVFHMFGHQVQNAKMGNRPTEMFAYIIGYFDNFAYHSTEIVIPKQVAQSGNLKEISK